MQDVGLHFFLTKVGIELIQASRFVCVTSKSTSTTSVLSNYYSKRRGTSVWNQTKIWEAARATSAASSFFDPITIAKEGFVDGATGANNPIGQVWSEALDIWQEPGAWYLEDNIQCLVSIGTGVPSLTPFGDDPVAIGKALLDIALDTENAANEFQKHHTKLYKSGRAFRFNVLRGLEKIGLEDASIQDEIFGVTRKYLQEEEVFNKIELCSEKLKERECVLSQFA
jgi:Patatin-like phospholipase